MASIGSDKNGRKRILFVDRDGKRKTIRLGTMSLKQAQLVCGHVEQLVNARSGGTPIPLETAEWVGGRGDVLRGRLENVGLVTPRVRQESWTVAAWVRSYIGRKAGASISTVQNLGQAERTLVEYLGADKPLAEFTAADATGYADFLHGRTCRRKGGTPLAEATIRRHCRRAKQFFTGAIDANLLTKNPFAKIPCADVQNKSRERFVTEGETKALLDVCPDTEWRLILSLAYYAGLRCPSEHNALTWTDVNWQTKSLTVRSPKTRRDKDGGVRHVPMAPPVAELLLTAFSEAGDGAMRIIARPLQTSNLRTMLYKLMDRANVERFGKPFVNMRATCETNWLAAGVPEYQVSKWIGHDVAVSRRHYDMTQQKYADLVTGSGTESGTVEAQKAAQRPAAQDCAGPRGENYDAQNPAFCEAAQSSAGQCVNTGPLTHTPKGI